MQRINAIRLQRLQGRRVMMLQKLATAAKPHQAPCSQPRAAVAFCMTAEEIIQKKGIRLSNTIKKCCISSDRSPFTCSHTSFIGSVGKTDWKHQTGYCAAERGCLLLPQPAHPPWELQREVHSESSCP